MHMKRIAAVLSGVLLATSAWGQHAGSGGHAGGGLSAGHNFAAPVVSRSFSGAPAFRPNASPQRSFASSTPAPFGGSYPYGANRGRYPYSGGRNRPYYSRGAYLVPGWLNSGFYDYGYGGSDYGDQQQAAAPPPDAYAQQGPSDEQAYAQMPARPVYESDAASSPDLQEQPEVKLVFKDGRPEQVVQNYAVTRTTLYVLDGAKRREIPLEQLDLSRTEKTNRDAGVDFEVPADAQ